METKATKETTTPEVTVETKNAEKAVAKAAKDQEKAKAKEAKDLAKAAKEKEKADKKAIRDAKPPKPVRVHKLTLMEINANLYGSAKTTLVSPVEKSGNAWKTSSSVSSNNNVLTFTKTNGTIVATTNDENPVTIKTRTDLETFIAAL